MSGKTTKHFVVLGLLALAAVCAAIMSETIRFQPNKRLERHRDVAEQYADSTPAGQPSTLPATLSDPKVEFGKDWVAFEMSGGSFFPRSTLYSLSSERPKNGLAGKPEIKTRRNVRGYCRYWVAG